MRIRPFSLLVGGLFLGIASVGGWILTLPPSLAPAHSTPPSLLIEEKSVVGKDLTEGEATAWNNAAKIAVDPQGGIYIVYQYAYGKRDKPNRMRYAHSSDGLQWEIEEWTGRYPTIAVDEEGGVYIAYVERTREADRLWLRARDPEGNETRRLIDEGPRRTRAYPALVPSEGGLFLAWETHEPGVHRIRFAEISRGGEIAKETVVEDERGVFFPTLAVDSLSRRIYLAWQAVEDARRYRIEVAVRDEGEAGWRFLGRVAGENGDGRSPTLAPLPPDEGEGASLAFVSLGPDWKSTLYRATLRGERLERPEEIARGPIPAQGVTELTTKTPTKRAPMSYGWASRAQAQSVADYTRELVAFPTMARGLVIWGHTVPDACGTGPLFWTWALGAAPNSNELLGAFASYPHLVDDPNEDGVFHLVWTDREVEELRAFEVRYARLRLQLPLR